MDRERDDALAEGEEVVRDGSVVIEEQIVRREGLVEYAGTVGEGAATSTVRVESAPEDAGMVDNAAVGGGAMQAGSTVLGGAARTEDTGTTAATGVAAETTVGATTRDMDPLSMSNDNSASGLMGSDTIESGPITRVREGMRVVDANGDDLGTVEDVKMGDPTAVTTVGEEPGGGGGDLADGAGVIAVGGGTSGSTGMAGAPGGAGAAAAGGLFGGGGAPDLPESFRNELVRVGYIRIDAKGWFGGDRYARADQIADVSGDTVRLTVAKEGLPSE